MRYSEKFKASQVEKMFGPGSPSTRGLSLECGVAQSTLWRWQQEAKLGSMNDKGRPRRRGPVEKMRIVREAGELDEAALGEFLRREGLHVADLERFREEVFEAAAKGFESGRKRRGLSPEQKELRAVKKELVRKEKALAEAAALLVLRGKWKAFLAAGEEGDTSERSGE